MSQKLIADCVDLTQVYPGAVTKPSDTPASEKEEERPKITFFTPTFRKCTDFSGISARKAVNSADLKYKITPQGDIQIDHGDDELFKNKTLREIWEEMEEAKYYH